MAASEPPIALTLVLLSDFFPASCCLEEAAGAGAFVLLVCAAGDEAASALVGISAAVSGTHLARSGGLSRSILGSAARSM